MTRATVLVAGTVPALDRSTENSMINDIAVSVAGWIGTKPERQIVSNGNSYARFRVASTPRHPNGNDGWSDGTTTWLTVKAWGELGENVLTSLGKGDPVVIRGDLKTETWTTEDGERSSLHIKAETVGPDLRTGTARFTRTVRSTADSGGHTAEDGTAPDDVDGLTGPDGARYEVSELAEGAAEETEAATV
ncbi:single-stranded DNA-binding protein [Georgenia alba]|uniref:Single-stranded DNA-binding protein n=1 Tax=Georgenia alba TaxID=2233858 RepID=A0ABW2Q6M8_9MICO